MSTTEGETVGLDFAKLRFAKEPMTSADALHDVVPMPWSDDEKSGKNSVVYSCPRKKKKEENKNVQSNIDFRSDCK